MAQEITILVVYIKEVFEITIAIPQESSELCSCQDAGCMAR